MRRWLGRVLCVLGRYDEAELLAQRGRELGHHEDGMTQQYWRQAQALVYSARGQHVDAERLAREAVDFSLRSDSPLYQGESLSDLAEVLEAAGRRDEAAATLREALDCYERKPIIPLARRTRERLAALEKLCCSRESAHRSSVGFLVSTPGDTRRNRGFQRDGQPLNRPLSVASCPIPHRSHWAAHAPHGRSIVFPGES